MTASRLYIHQFVVKKNFSRLLVRLSPFEPVCIHTSFISHVAIQSPYNRLGISGSWYRPVDSPICRSVCLSVDGRSITPEGVQRLNESGCRLEWWWGRSMYGSIEGSLEGSRDRRRAKGSFGGECGHPIVTSGDFVA